MNYKDCDTHKLSTIKGKQKRGILVTVPPRIKYYKDMNMNYHAENVERRSNKQ